MKLLMLSIDKTILDPASRSAARIKEYGEVVGDLVVFVVGSHGGKTRVAQFLRSWRATIHEARRFRPDVVTAQDPFFTGFLAWRAARATGAGLHLQLHGDFFGSPYWSRTFFWRVKLALGKFLLCRADAVRVVSWRVRQSIASLVSRSRIAVAPIPFVSEPRNEKREPSNHRSILCVSRLEKEKGVDVLIRAFFKLKDPDVRLVIVGEGKERDALLYLAKDLGLADRVQFVGHQKNLGPYYASASICVIPSRTESWGRVALEAMAAACPVVMTNVGLAGEVIKDEESGLLVSTEDPDALANAIDRILADESLRAKLVLGGLEALKRLDPPDLAIKKMVDSWKQALRPIVMITQILDPNDPNLGFVNNWVAALGEHVPVRVIEFRRMGFLRLLRELCYEVARSRGVFAHMCPEYAIVAAPLARFFGKKTLLWYTHKSVTWRLRLAALLVDQIFTASRESCRIKSSKVAIVGHGIKFNYQLPITNYQLPNTLRLLIVGRMSPVKDFETPIRAVAELAHLGDNVSLTIVGGPYLPADHAYEAYLRQLASSLGVTPMLHIMGARRHGAMAAIYREHDVLIHTSRTGSVDKVVLEALGLGISAVSSSEAFASLLPAEARFNPGAVDELVKILHNKAVFDLNWQPIFLRVRAENDLTSLMRRIADFFRT